MIKDNKLVNKLIASGESVFRCLDVDIKTGELIVRACCNSQKLQAWTLA